MPKYGGKEIAAAFRTVRKNTVQVAEDIPENKYNFKATPDTRSIAQTLVHIAYAPEFAFYIHGEKISDMEKVNFPVLFEKIAAEESKVRRIAPIAGDRDTMAESAQGLGGCHRNAAFQIQPAGSEFVIAKRTEQVFGLKARRFHGFLRRHVKLDDVQQHLQ